MRAKASATRQRTRALSPPSPAARAPRPAKRVRARPRSRASAPPASTRKIPRENRGTPTVPDARKKRPKSGDGAATPTGIKEAARAGIPRDRIIGWWWSGSEEDVTPAGDAAKGFITAQFHATGPNYPVFEDIKKYVYAKGQGNVEENRIGSVYYVRGVLHGVTVTEAMRTAMAKFGNRPLTGDEVRWGLEHLVMTKDRIKELGLEGLMPEIKVTCADHEGGGAIRFQQWDGAKWVMISDWIKSDQSMVRPLIEASAAQYAREKGITPRDCAGETN